MNPKNIDILLENQSLKTEFKIRGLDLSQVFIPDPEDLKRENQILKNLLDWVRRYAECGSREQMMREGYDFPPVDPCLSPESDWLRFELWMQGKPLRYTLREKLPGDYTPVPALELTDDTIQMALDELSGYLENIGISAEFHNPVPPRLIYEHLLEVLDEEFEVTEGGCWHLDGCTGCCPGCFQRPWCESGLTCCWDEDEQTGKMHITDAAARYVSASPGSLEILRKLQADEDAKMAEIKDRPLKIDPIPPDIFPG